MSNGKSSTQRESVTRKRIRLPGGGLETGERIKAYLSGFLLCLAGGWLTWRSVIGVMILVPLVFIFVSGREKEYRQAKNKKNRGIFSEAIISMADALSAGYSVEGALGEATRELVGKYGDKNDTVRGFVEISNKVRNSISIEKAFESFADEMDIDDAKSFSEVLFVAKRMGGDLISIISGTAQGIHDRTEVEKEIDSILGAKKFELRLVQVMPPGIILYLNVFGGGILDPLYCTLAGRVIMTAMLASYFALSKYAKKIVAIDV